MSFLKRISDGFWSYVSPAKSSATPAKTTPQTLPRAKRPARPSAPRKHGSMQDIKRKHKRSMSPVERVDSWRIGSSSQAESPAQSKKRKRKSYTSPTADAGRRRKARKTDYEDMDYVPEFDDDMDFDMVDVKEEPMDDGELNDEDESIDANIDVAPKSPSPASRPKSRSKSASPGYVYEETIDDSLEVDTSLVVEDEPAQYQPYRRMKMLSPNTEHFSRGVSTEELRAQGWDDDYITLVQRIAMRGYEPLLSRHWKFEWRFMPDALFIDLSADEDEAFVRTVRGDHFHGGKALERLFELGGRVRDRILLKNRMTPEQQVRKQMQEYMKWATKDAGIIDEKSAIPLLALEMKPLDTHADILQENAKRKLGRLAARWREAFRVSQSIENSPASRTSTVLSYPIPTLYAIIASHTLIALCAYKPDEIAPGSDEPDLHTIAFFNMKDKDYDVWNALALAIVACHVRNVQMRIAEETGVGMKVPGGEEVVEDDPDA